MENLPAELFEIIFTHLDGQSLARVSKVNKKWNDVVIDLENRKCIWKVVCLRDIPVHVLEELLGNRYIPQEVPVDWKSIYRSWFCGNMIASWSYCQKKMPIPKSPITCVKLTGAYVLTGHRNGSICAWHEFKFNHVVAKHLTMVTDFALLDNLHLGQYFPKQTLWDHLHIVSVSKDYSLQVNFLLDEGENIDEDMPNFYYHGSALTSVRVFGDVIVVSAADNTLLVFKAKVDETKSFSVLNLNLTATIPQKYNNSPAFGFWHNEIRTMCFFNGALMVHSLDTAKSRKTMLKIDKKQFIVRNVTHVFFFRKNVAFFVMSDGEVLITVDGEILYEHHLVPILHSTIHSIALRGSVLALGTEAGKLFLYCIPGDSDLRHLNFSKPAWCSVLSEASIISIDISNDNESPVVVAATSERIFFIKWRQKQPCNVSSLQEIDIKSHFRKA